MKQDGDHSQIGFNISTILHSRQYGSEGSLIRKIQRLSFLDRYFVNAETDSSYKIVLSCNYNKETIPRSTTVICDDVVSSDACKFKVCFRKSILGGDRWKLMKSSILLHNHNPEICVPSTVDLVAVQVLENLRFAEVPSAMAIDDSDDNHVSVPNAVFNKRSNIYHEGLSENQFRLTSITVCQCDSVCGSTCLNYDAFISCNYGNCNIIKIKGRTADCGNRHRFSHPVPVEIAEEKGKGMGLKLLADVDEGEFIGFYAGEVITRAEMLLRKSNYVVSFSGFYLDAEVYGSKMRFINHKRYVS